jgi:tripartite-type tricarboxylate transporter receptor subunit TctC
MGAAALPAVSLVASAEVYPSRPVHIIVGFPPGGAADTTARLMGQWLSERLGQPFIIENRPGASGNIATEAVVRAPPDGYTVVRAPPDGYTLLMVVTNNAGNATLYDKLNFNFIRDIAPVASINRVPHVIDVNPSIPVRTVPEFIAFAKANPGKLNMGSGSIGSTQHLSGELFKMMTGVNIVHVPYRGGAPAIADLLGGQVTNCKISLCHSDLALSISRRANTGAMRFAKCAVSIGPGRIVGVKPQKVLPQRVNDGRQGHWRSRMARVGLLNGIHREGANGIYAKLIGHGAVFSASAQRFNESDRCKFGCG